MKSLTIPVFYEYLMELTLAELEQELETAQAEYTEAHKAYVSASSYGGFKAAQRIATRAKSAANESIKYIKQAIKERGSK